MPRRVQDIVPGNHRSIRDIPVEIPPQAEMSQAPRPRKTGRTSDIRHPAKNTVAEEKPQSHRKKDSDDEMEAPIDREIAIRRMPVTPPPPSRKKSRGSGKWILITLGIIVLVAGAGYVASTYFARATFTIVPRIIPVQVSGTYVITSNPVNGGLSYELVTVRGTASSTVVATDGPQTSTKAEGKVTVYNAFDDQAQRLVAGTRLADESGRIYRLTSSVTVPGSSSGGSVPGSVTADVVADVAGQGSNVYKASAPGDLKFVGFKGTPRYDAFYARLSTDITGGFVGAKKTVSPTVLASSTENIKTVLTAKLLSQIKASIPEGYIMYDSAKISSFTSPIVGGTDQKTADISVQGTVTGILFKKKDLVAKIAGDGAVSSFGEFSYASPGLETLSFTIANAKDFSVEKKNSLIVNLKGSMKLVGAIPVEEIKKKFAGVSLGETQELLKPYSPVVESGSGELVPPWSKVPTDTSKITIVVKDDVSK